MVRNTQSQERAFQAAEVAIEDALANPVLSTSADHQATAVLSAGHLPYQLVRRPDGAGTA
jgi:hypothetical protein